MVGRILLINPSKPRGKRVPARAGVKRRRKLTATRRKNPMKRRSAAQRAATKRLVAFNKSRKSNPIRRRKARRSLAAVPRSRVRRRRNPIGSVRRISRRRHRNPIAIKGLLHSLVMPALTASTGALLLDVLWAKLPIPANLKAGSLQYITKGVGAVALSMIAEKSKVVNRQTAQAMGVGALTVVFHDALRGVLKGLVPQLGFSEYVGGMGYINAGWPAGTLDAPNTAAGTMGEYVGDYMSGGADYDADDAYAGYYYGR